MHKKDIAVYLLLLSIYILIFGTAIGSQILSWCSAVLVVISIGVACSSGDKKNKNDKK